MADVQWIKLYVNMFNVSRKLKQIEQMKGGDTILLIWIKLLCLSGSVNDGGMIYVTPEIPYTIEGLSEELRKPVSAVKNALKVLELYGKIVVDHDGFIKVSSWAKYQDIDKMEEIRAKDRERKRLKRTHDNTVANSTESPRNIHGISMENPRIEEEGEEDVEFHSFNLSITREKEDDEKARERDRIKRELIGGTLGGGVVMLSEAEIDSLLDELSLDEFNYYVGVVRDCEKNGQRYKRKTHYKAILEMARKDRSIKS